MRAGIAAASIGAVSLAFGSVAPAFAGDGGGTGGEEGGGGSGEGSATKDFIWFDRGGFVDRGGFQPEQGWDSASADYFKGLMEQKLGLKMATRWRPTFGKNNDRIFYDSAETALANARRRAGTSHARVIGVGWWWFRDDENQGSDYFAYAVPDDSWWSTWDVLMQRPGNNDELPAELGWGDTVNGTNEAWRDYIWNLGFTDTPGHLYTLVVAAVADTEPPRVSGGEASMTKEPSHPTWLSDPR